MLTDLLLASLHHLLFFALIAMLVTESVLLRGTVDGPVVQRLARLDSGYGMSAGLILVVGLLRVFKGVKGYDFYLHNPWFHAKLGCFVLVGLLSILPTVRFLRWRRARRVDPGWRVPEAEWRSARRWVLVELHLLALIPLAAVIMSRGLSR
jgi:putative membrane protein